MGKTHTQIPGQLALLSIASSPECDTFHCSHLVCLAIRDQQGLGYLLMTAIGLHNVDLIMSVTLVLSVLAIAASLVLLAVDRRIRRRLG